MSSNRGHRHGNNSNNKRSGPSGHKFKNNSRKVSSKDAQGTSESTEVGVFVNMSHAAQFSKNSTDTADDNLQQRDDRSAEEGTEIEEEDLDESQEHNDMADNKLTIPIRICLWEFGQNDPKRLVFSFS